MKPERITSLPLIFLLIILPACSTSQARDQLLKRQQEMQQNGIAWNAARLRLRQLCPSLPKTVAEYEQGKAIRTAGKFDPFRGCDGRLVKISASPMANDWQWEWLPSYATIVSIHDEELRKRVAPKLYEEYMLGLGRYLAEKTDGGVITPIQLRQAFTEGWLWMFKKVQDEQILLQQNIQVAEASDSATWNTLGVIAAGLALIAGAALVAAATAPQYTSPPPPIVNCTAVRTGNIVTATCF